MLKQCLENIGEGLLHACISFKFYKFNKIKQPTYRFPVELNFGFFDHETTEKCHLSQATVSNKCFEPSLLWVASFVFVFLLVTSPFTVNYSLNTSCYPWVTV
jgi:hypothetical protein